MMWLASLRSAAIGFGLLALSACGSAQRGDGGSGHLPAGAPVPALSGPDQAAVEQRVGGPGPVTIVYFYPRDATPGCTKEACAFRDTWQRFQSASIRVLGVSNDDSASHARFAAEHQLPFSLVADTDGRWARAFGVGSTLGFYERVTFLLDRNGRVAKVYPSVDPAVHASQVLADATALR